jgi:hypothetical protein
MRDQHAEIECAIVRCNCPTERRTIEIDHQRPVQLAIFPIVSEPVRRDKNRRQRTGRFGLDETKPFFQFCRDEIAKRNIVHQPDQPYTGQRILRRNTTRDVARHNDYFCLQITAPSLIGQRYVIASAEQFVRTALIHQRIMPEAFGQFSPPCLPYQFDMVHIGRTVGPLICTGQWSGRVMLMETLKRDRAVFEVGCQRLQSRRDIAPIVQGGL